jgi:hypothetical protein
MGMIFKTISKRAVNGDDTLSETEKVDDVDAAWLQLRERIKEALLRFPEAAALCPRELEAAVDRIIVQASPETASPAAPGKVRLSDQLLSIFIRGHESLNPSVDELPGVGPGGAFPLGWIEARRRELDEECREENKQKDGHDPLLVLLAKIRVDLLTRGYVEVQWEYMQPANLPDV